MTPTELFSMFGILCITAYASYRIGRTDEKAGAKDILITFLEIFFKKGD